LPYLRVTQQENEVVVVRGEWSECASKKYNEAGKKVPPAIHRLVATAAVTQAKAMPMVLHGLTGESGWDAH
jgi:hypothetical protein